jgi:hypothetical protein
MEDLISEYIYLSTKYAAFLAYRRRHDPFWFREATGGNRHKSCLQGSLLSSPFPTVTCSAHFMDLEPDPSPLSLYWLLRIYDGSRQLVSADWPTSITCLCQVKGIRTM